MTDTEKKVLDSNKKIDRDVVAAFSELQKQIPAALGRQQGAAYSLSLPLDDSALMTLEQKK